MNNVIELRHDGRLPLETRAIKITPGVFEYAPGSVFFELGKTKILCAVSMQQQVPHFLKGKKEGWLTCEYSLLPMSTTIRSQRESSLGQKNGRSVEISRFLGRVIRSVIDFSVFPDRTIVVDCDVLQADGSTRVASVMAASIALEIAQRHWLEQKIIMRSFLSEQLYATSVGIINDTVCIDIDFLEDSNAQADFNFVITASGKLVEVLGGAEKQPIAWELFVHVQHAAQKGIAITKEIIVPIIEEFNTSSNQKIQQKKAPIFSLQNRLFNKEIQ